MVEKWLSGGFLLVSLCYAYFATDLNFGILAKPKAGFMPNIVGTLAVILCSINLFVTLKKKSESGKEDGIDSSTAFNILLFLAGTAIYIFALDKTGYFIATTLYLFYLLKVTKTSGYLKPAIVSLSVVSAFYVCFEVLLGVVLP